MKTSQLLPLALLALVTAGRLMAQAPAPGAPAPAPGAAAQPPALPAAPAAAPAGGPTLVEPELRGTAVRADAGGQDLITVDFPSSEVSAIISSVAELFDLNVVVPDTLQGRTTIKLKGVTWRQIFNTVLDPVGYTYQEEGNIIKVVSKDSLQQEPNEINILPLSYANATDVMATVSGLINTGTGGKISVNPRINALVITEKSGAMNKIRMLITELDRPTDQVMIETKFIEVTDGDIKNLGVNWSVLKGYQIGATPAGTFSRNRAQALNDGVNGSNIAQSSNTTNTTGSQSISSSTGSPSSASLSNTVDSAIQSGITSTLNFLNGVANTGGTSRETSAVFSASQFGFVLSALNELSRTKIVSSPTIVTQNNITAKINVGEEDPVPNYTYNDQRGSFEVSGFKYMPIGIILEVTPQVNNAGIISLKLKPVVSQKQGTVNFGGAGGAEIPIIATRNLETTVQLKNGYTMGLGGLLRTQTDNSGSSVPLVGKIPFLGKLFQTKSRTENTTNLLIFVTAKTMSADGAAPEQVFTGSQIRDAGLLRSDLPGYRDSADPFLPTPPAATPRQSLK